MAKLWYKTKGNSDPTGKPRVYFCCHPKDFDTYFESISEEILGKQNCAIWYKQKTAEEYDELFLQDLEQMNLFVMPVTSNLLGEENDTLNVEFKFAIEHCIPVLPLMQEEKLEAKFNEKCGDLQFLDKSAVDETAISYEEKLTDFLSSVLISDELAKKIRDAFDAYIFLSYRKKDRKHAQELMRLIHRNQAYQNIAIWYDEFLTPGENFNDSIMEALKKSDLFVLAVTPNLVNETNYVMKTEYPLAQKEKKTILPIKLLPTNKLLLALKFKGIPQCINAYDEKEMTEALLKMIKNIALKEHGDTPEHNFFIGLAYLNGIDVEIDHERAAALITSAAERDLIEAVEKLISMYQKGEGVVRDYEKALQWREKYVRLLEKQARCSNLEADIVKWLKELVNLGDEYCHLYLEQKGKDTFLYGYQACEEYKEILEKQENKRIFMRLYDRLYGIFSREGNMEMAYKYLKNTASILGDSLETSEPGSLADLENQYYIAILAELFKASAGSVDESQDIKPSHALKIAEEIYYKYDAGRSILAGQYDLLADRYCCIRDFLRAEEYYQKALALREELFSITGDPEDFRAICKSYLKIMDLSKLENHPEKEKEQCEKLVSLRKQIADETKLVQDVCDLVNAWHLLASFYEKQNDLEQGEIYEQKALALMVQLVEENDDPEALSCIGKISRIHVGWYTLDKKNPLAKKYYLEMLEIRKKILEKTGDTNMAEALCKDYRGITYFYDKKQDQEIIKDCYLKIIEIDIAYLSDNYTVRENLEQGKTTVYEDLCTLYENEKNISAVKECITKLVELMEIALGQKESLEIRRKLPGKYQKLSRLAEEDFETALEYAKKALSCEEKLAEDDPNRNCEDLIKSHNRLGALYKKQGDLEKARDHYEIAIQMCRTMLSDAEVDKEDSYDYLRYTDFIHALLNLGQICAFPEKEQVLRELLEFLDSYMKDTENDTTKLIFKNYKKRAEEELAKQPKVD